MKVTAFKYCLFTFLVVMTMQAMPQQRPTNEYQLKAAFLYNFTRFVTWPEETLAIDASFVIGVVGPDPFGSYLDETVKGETVQGHPIVVRRFTSAESVKACHILFINVTDKAVIRQLSEQGIREHMLTVGDAIAVEKQGGMVRFVAEHNKTRFRINLAASRDAGLTISSKLLTLAEIIRE